MSDLIRMYLSHQLAAGRTERTREVRTNMLRTLHAALPYGLAYASTEHLDQWLATPGWTRGTRAAYARRRPDRRDGPAICAAVATQPAVQQRAGRGTRRPGTAVAAGRDTRCVRRATSV